MLDTFTRRHRLDFEVQPLHYQSIPLAMRLDFLKLVLDKAHEHDAGTLLEYRAYRILSLATNQDYLKLVGEDDIYEGFSTDMLVEVIQRSSWHQFLSMLEVSANRLGVGVKKITALLAYHHVGYTLAHEAGEWRAEVKYDAVVEELDKAVDTTAPYPKINELIRQARKDLADPNNIQIESSIKHSMLALEGFMIQWLDERINVKCGRLGEVVKAIKSRNLADPQIAEALHQFYIYRNRTPNIGHGSVQDADATAADALLINDMAVSFVNYFGRKAVE